ncbi:MAG: hypothetical protein PF588_05845, partial [Candidatus Kapabacteria bacterium]|nr:hypothetical protein [Candidatus Kapabacteria bacterium]
MKKYFRFILFPTLILFGIIFFAACEYEPTGNHFVEVDPNTPPLIYDVELNWDKDTIWQPANQSIYLRYNFTNSNKKFLQAYVVVDDSLHKTSDTRSNNFGLFPVLKQTALDTHRVVFEAHFASGTGSLADLAELERFVVKKEWVIIYYDIQRFDLPKITVKKIDGKLEISWKKPPIDSIISYRLTKFVLDGYNCPEILTVYSSIDSCSFVDPHYVGESANYQLILKAAGSNKAYYYPESRYSGNFPKLQYETINDTTLRLFWNKCEFPENFDAYLINVSYRGDTITDINTTSVIVDNYYFGSNREFRLNIKPKITHYYQMTYYGSDNYSSTLNLLNGQTSFDYYFAYSAGKNNLVYNYQYSDYGIIDINNNDNIKKILTDNPSSYYLSSSSNGQYIVYTESDY